MNALVPSSSRYGTNGGIAIRQPPARMIRGASNRKRLRRPYLSLIASPKAVVEVDDTVAESVFVEKLEPGTHVGR